MGFRGGRGGRNPEDDAPSVDGRSPGQLSPSRQLEMLSRLKLFELCEKVPAVQKSAHLVDLSGSHLWPQQDSCQLHTVESDVLIRLIGIPPVSAYDPPLALPTPIDVLHEGHFLKDIAGFKFSLT